MEHQEYRQVPVYRLLAPFWDGEELIETDFEIEFDGVPNESMEPLNEPARERMIDFIYTLQDGKRTPDLGEIVFEQMKRRPKADELTSPELIAAMQMIQASAEKRVAVAPEDRKKAAIVLPKKADEEAPLMTGGEVARRERVETGEPRRRTKIVRGPGKASSDPTKRKRVMSYSTATVEGREYE